MVLWGNPCTSAVSEILGPCQFHLSHLSLKLCSLKSPCFFHSDDQFELQQVLSTYTELLACDGLIKYLLKQAVEQSLGV